MYSRVYVEITNTCNMNCPFCHGTTREARNMSLGEFARITSNLRGITEHLYFHVLGEPLLHPMLPIFIEHAKKCGFKVVLTTNGTLLREKGEQLLLTKPYKVNISLHSADGERKNARNDSLLSCIDFADMASDAGILVILRLWNLPDRNDIDRESETGKLNSDIVKVLRERFGEFEQTDSRGFRIKNKLHVEYGKRFEWPDAGAKDFGESVFCYGLNDHFAILSDGTVVPCCLDADGVIELGNIFEQDINDILKSGRAVAMRNGFAQKKAVEQLCRHCGYARRFSLL